MTINDDSNEPRWPAFVATFAVGGLYLAIPASLTIGPRWLMMAVVALFSAPLILTHRRNSPRLNTVLAHLLLGVITVFMITSLVLLVHALPVHTESPRRLLVSAVALWLTNILVFASWYWRLDAGGPNARDRRTNHSGGSFLFPQMTLLPQVRAELGQTNWSPQFMDYLFLAFNTSTAFSPTDTPILSRWAKLLTIVQSVISLVVVVLLAARAVNIL